MTFDIENEASSGSGTSTPRLHARRNALPHILQGYSVSDLEGVYRSTEDISRVLLPVPSPCKDQEEDAQKGSSPSAPQERLRQRRNAVCYDSVPLLLASGAMLKEATSGQSQARSDT